MNRITKFRAYWKNRQPQLGMCRVNSINFEENRADISNDYVRVFPKLDEIVSMQFTGLKDKTGREIYEGDILQLNGDMDKGKLSVTFENGSFTNGHGVPIYNIILENEGDDWEKNIAKVVGNIFENPELLNAHDGQKGTVPS